ncbi:MAG: sulfite exporter TauE/SafE family protein [Actinomycetia bacterium]|nr:sulfite exporter TauE/SafE family protein [Actinomycetes bacterium]
MNATELAIALVVITIASGVKAITGMGFPLMVIPVLSLILPLEEAVVIVAIPNAVANVALVGRERTSWPDTRDLPALLGFGLVGAVAGVFLLVSVPERGLLFALAALVAGFVTTSLLHPEFRIGEATGRRWAPVAGLAAGLSQGSLGISGPIVVPWIQSYRLPRNAQVLAVSAIFLLTGLSQVATLAASGRYDGERLALGLAAVIPTLAAIPIGTRFRDRLGRVGFDRAVLAIVALSGVSILARAVAG